jgi:hypothetical protein
MRASGSAGVSGHLTVESVAQAVGFDVEVMLGLQVEPATIAGDLEAAATPAPFETARAVINFMRGYQIERLLDPRLSIAEGRRRINLLLPPTG